MNYSKKKRKRLMTASWELGLGEVGGKWGWPMSHKPATIFLIPKSERLRVCLDTAYFIEIENLLLKVL